MGTRKIAIERNKDDYDDFISNQQQTDSQTIGKAINSPP